MRKRAGVLVVAMVAFLLVGGAGAKSSASLEHYPPFYYTYENGTVVIEGDVGVSCRMFASEEFYPM